MDDFEKYEQLADNPKYRADVEFAMYGAKNFGMKAVPILGTTATYGDDYPKILKEALTKSISQGGVVGSTTDIDKEFLIKADMPTDKPRFTLHDMKQKCDEVIKARNAEILLNKLDTQMKPKPETRQQSMKTKI